MSEFSPSDQEPAPFDELWYGRFVEINQLTTEQNFDGDPKYRDEQNRKFIQGEVNNPTLDYPNLDKDVLEHAEVDLLSLKQDLLAQEPNEVVRQAYRWSINERIAKIRRKKAVLDWDMHRFSRYNEFLYGPPSPDIFNYTINSIRSKANDALNSEDETIKHAAEELLAELPPYAPYKSTALPDEETVHSAHRHTVEEFGSLIDLPSDNGELDAEQIQAAFEFAIQQVQADGWQVEIDNKTSKSTISVRQGSHKVIIPQSRKAETDDVAALIVHEIGTHVARRVNGERTSLKLLGFGLDRYDRGDEGVGVMREQALKDKVSDFRGLASYLAIGLTVGLDGQPRDFRQVYSVLQKYYMMDSLISGNNQVEATEKASKDAWERCVRTFRGTGGLTSGICSYEDLYYRDGNIGVWNVIKNNPAELIRFNIGKYDPANSRHVWILEELGITDQDLDSLSQ